MLDLKLIDATPCTIGLSFQISMHIHSIFSGHTLTFNAVFMTSTYLTLHWTQFAMICILMWHFVVYHTPKYKCMTRMSLSQYMHLSSIQNRSQYDNATRYGGASLFSYLCFSCSYVPVESSAVLYIVPADIALTPLQSIDAGLFCSIKSSTLVQAKRYGGISHLSAVCYRDNFLITNVAGKIDMSYVCTGSIFSWW